MKQIFTIGLIMTTMILFSCAPATKSSGSTEQTTSNEPEWWFNPADSETHYYGFGQAKKTKSKLSSKSSYSKS